MAMCVLWGPVFIKYVLLINNYWGELLVVECVRCRCASLEQILIETQDVWPRNSSHC